jgi:hypothetical protein
VNKNADETPQGWYCACCSAPEPPMPHIHVPLCPMSPCQGRNRFLDSSRMAGGAMQGQLPKNQSHVLIPSPPTSPIVMRLEHEGSALGLLVTTVSSVRNRPSKNVREHMLGGTAVEFEGRDEGRDERQYRSGCRAYSPQNAVRSTGRQHARDNVIACELPKRATLGASKCRVVP